MVSSAIIYSAMVLVAILILIGAIDHWGVFEDDKENANSGTERVQQELEQQNEDYTISLLKKHKTLTAPGKVVVASLGALCLGLLVYVYFTLKNGAPVEVPFANALQQSAVVTAVFFVAVGVANKRTSNRRKATIVYEDENGYRDRTETKYFDPAKAERDGDGNLILYENLSARILGLFERRKLVAYDRELRGERAVLHDHIAHRIPESAIELDDGHWKIRTQGHRVTSNGDVSADYTYDPPYTVPFETHVKNRERIAKMQTKLDSKDAMLAEVEQEVSRLRRKVDTERTDAREALKDDLMDIVELIQSPNAQYDIQQDTRPQRQPESQRDVAGMNGRKNGEEGSTA